MINLSSAIQPAVPLEHFMKMAGTALKFAADELQLPMKSPWPAPVRNLEDQLGALQNFVLGGAESKTGSQALEEMAFAVAFGFKERIKIREWAQVREAVRLALIDLSFNGAILLPAHEDFHIGKYSEFESSRNRPLVVQFLNVLTANPEMSKRGTKRFSSLVAATDWRHLKDFSLDDFALLNQALIRNAPDRAKEGSALAVLPMLNIVEQLAPSVLPRDLRHQYMMWQASSMFLSTVFNEFKRDPKNFNGLRVHGHKRERVETPELIGRRTQRNNRRNENRRANQDESVFVLRLREIAASGVDNAPDTYFAALGGGRSSDFRKEGWLQDITPYPGREQILIRELGKSWISTMAAWMAHRESRFETDKEVRLCMHMLIDYLFLYLPWWNELHPDLKVDIPGAPKHFVRYLFVSRTVFHGEQGGDQLLLPKTLTEMLALRRPTPDSKNTALGHLHRFFQFVITAFEDNDLIAGKKMVNPIRLDFDRVKSARRSKTDKVPFAENVYPLLVFYFQAVESFGEYLQQVAYDQDRFKNLATGAQYGYDTETWGYVPYVRYRGEVLPICWIPNVYTVARRALYANPENNAGIYVNGKRLNRGLNRVMTFNIPHLTVVRMLLSMLETGLRGQSMQWLDRLNWDSLCRVKTPIAKLYTWDPPEMFTKLLVNTDKSKDEPWTTYVSWRVRRSLLAESYFQACLAEPNVDEAVLYEGRKNSRFEPIVPLFRSYLSSKPFGDNTYLVRWLELLQGFEQFYNRKPRTANNPRESLVLVTLEPALDANGSFLRTAEILDGSVKSIVEYCQLKYSTEHTPHSARSTYATLKDGDLEVSEIAEQIGHGNTVTTNYYQVPSEFRVKAKLEGIEAKLENMAYDVEGAGGGYIDAENVDSTVRRAFAANRDAAILDFGFTSGVALWSLADLSSDEENSIELLRRSPSSVIRWHTSHVCPVGNQCPSEIVVKTGGFQRCGLCPLAVKCIDHLPAVVAKKNELKERIRMSAMQIMALSKRKGATQNQRDALHRCMNLDAKELMGWELSAQILHDKKQLMGAEQESYHVDQPEMVRRHLELVTRDSSTAEFFLQRIADANAYPSFESPEIRARAAKYVQIILARAGREDDAALLELEPFSELAAFASLIKPMADAKGLGVGAIADMLSGGKRNELGVASGLVLLGSKS
jgi:hypothetical protein